MFEIKDSDAGLALTMDRDPEPRDPRLVEEPFFTVVSWERGLGDPHDWLDPKAFHAAIRPKDHAIFPLVRFETAKGPVLMRKPETSGSDKPVIGYAFASFEQIRLRFGLDVITPEIRDEVMMDAEAECLGELQAVDDYVQGEVYRYTIVDRRLEVIERGRDLYGEDHARHVARTAFEAHLYGVTMDG